MIKELKTGKRALEIIGAENIEPYTLISNYGFTFYIGEIKFDVRFWANNYGFELNEWRTHLATELADDEMFVRKVSKTICVLVDYLFNTSNLDE